MLVQSVMILKHLLSIQELYITVDIIYTHPVHHFCEQLRVSAQQKPRFYTAVQTHSHVGSLVTFLFILLYYCVSSITSGCRNSIIFPKRNVYLNIHRVSVKPVPHNLKISYCRDVCNSRHNNRIPSIQYIGIITVCHQTTFYAVHHLPSVTTQLQSCHVAI